MNNRVWCRVHSVVEAVSNRSSALWQVQLGAYEELLMEAAGCLWPVSSGFPPILVRFSLLTSQEPYAGDFSEEGLGNCFAVDMLWSRDACYAR